MGTLSSTFGACNRYSVNNTINYLTFRENFIFTAPESV